MFKRKGVVVVIFLICCCSPVKYFKISVLVPAIIEFPSEVRGISIVTTVNEYNTPKGMLDSMDNIVFERGFNYYTLTYDYLYGMANVLTESPRFSKIVISDIDSNYLYLNRQVFNWSDIIKLCRTDTTEAAIMISNFYLRDSLGLNNLLEYYCYLTFKIDNYVEFVVLYPKELKVLGKYSINTPLYWETTGGASCEQVYDQLPDAVDMISESCFITGQKIGRSIAPLWNDNEGRIIFHSGNKTLRAGSSLVNKGDWTSAAGLWSDLFEFSDPKLASKAAFNMAVASEMVDHLDIAYNWVNISDSLYSTSYSLIYKSILKKRLQERNVLENQMKIKND